MVWTCGSALSRGVYIEKIENYLKNQVLKLSVWILEIHYICIDTTMAQNGSQIGCVEEAPTWALIGLFIHLQSHIEATDPFGIGGPVWYMYLEPLGVITANLDVWKCVNTGGVVVKLDVHLETSIHNQLVCKWEDNCTYPMDIWLQNLIMIQCMERAAAWALIWMFPLH